MSPPPVKRAHEYDPAHPRRPVYFPEITLGNWLAIITILGTVGAAYSASESRVVKVEERIVANKTEVEAAVARNTAQIDRVSQDQKEAILRIEHRLDKLDDNLLTLIKETRQAQRRQ